MSSTRFAVLSFPWTLPVFLPSEEAASFEWMEAPHPISTAWDLADDLWFETELVNEFDNFS